MIAESGSIFTKDEYDQFYNVDWETVRGDLDITTITKTPYVWGETPSGFTKNGILFRRGIISVQRQIIRVLDNGYEIVAEGSSQYEDYIQMNFPCETGPTDPFAHHVNCRIIDEPIFRVTDGPRWADPDEPGDADAIWGDLTDDGCPVGDLTGTGGLDILEWIDVWGDSFVVSIAFNDDDATIPEPEISRSVIRKVTAVLNTTDTINESDVAIRKRDGGGLVGIDSTVITKLGVTTTVEMTFNGGTHTDVGLDSSSLEDGNYELLIKGEVVFGDEICDLFYRLVGDISGTGTVTAADAAVVASLNFATRPTPPFRGDCDLNNDGFILSNDASIAAIAVGNSRDISGYGS